MKAEETTTLNTLASETSCENKEYVTRLFKEDVAKHFDQINKQSVKNHKNKSKKPKSKLKSKVVPVTPKSGFTFIDLFAGIGGFRIPLENIGGECVFSSEIDNYSQKTYKSWFGETRHGDITKISAADIPDHHILAAGFPYQPFSIKL